MGWAAPKPCKILQRRCSGLHCCCSAAILLGPASAGIHGPWQHLPCQVLARPLSFHTHAWALPAPWSPARSACRSCLLRPVITKAAGKSSLDGQKLLLKRRQYMKEIPGEARLTNHLPTQVQRVGVCLGGYMGAEVRRLEPGMPDQLSYVSLPLLFPAPQSSCMLSSAG